MVPLDVCPPPAFTPNSSAFYLTLTIGMRSAVLLLIALTHLAQASIACVGRHAKHSDSRSDYRNLTRRSATSQRCTDRPQIIDYQCRQGYPSSLTMTIEVPTDGQNDCTVSLFRESDIISTFVYKPETDGKQTISVPSEYMLSSITGYNGGNDIGQAPRDIICPYERLPVRCVITVTGVRGIKGPNGGFFSLVSGSIQPGCGPLSYYIEGDLADYGMADDFDFQSTKELPAGDYTITVYNNPADEAEFDVAEPVDFRFSLGGPETSVSTRHCLEEIKMAWLTLQLRRRRLECNLDEELCYDARGRLRVSLTPLHQPGKAVG